MQEQGSTHDWDLVHMYGDIGLDQLLPIRPTVIAGLTHWARANPDHPFITAHATDGTISTITYGDTERFSHRLAHWFQAERQLGEGDVVGYHPTNDIPSVLILLGLLRSGCTVIVLNPSDPESRVAEQSEATGAKFIVRNPEAVADIPGAVEVPNSSVLADISGDMCCRALRPLADAFYIPTSGSTAASKLVAQSHYNAAVNAEALRRHHGLQPGLRVLGCLPIHHVNGLHFSIFATMMSGAHLLLAREFSPFTYTGILERYKPHIASVVPSILEALLVTWRKPAIPSDFRYFVSAAAPLSHVTCQALTQKMGCRILQGYGLTETTNFSTILPADISDDTYRRLMIESEIPSIGTPLFGNEVRILTSDGRQAEDGQSGEICMRGHSVMMRYAGNECATKESFRGGWFHSQDLGHTVRDRDTGRQFVVITGRVKNVAKVRGESVSLDELDRFLRALAFVHDAACVAVPNRMLGEEIIAGVVVAPGYSNAELLRRLETAFSPSSIPRRVVQVKSIPRTQTGKLRRKVLTQLLVESN